MVQRRLNRNSKMVMIVKKKKIAAVDFNPKSLLGQPADVARKVLGVVGGIAQGLTESISVTGEIFVGLRGAFRFEPSDGGEILTASVLWLPTGFDDDVKALLSSTDAEGVPNGPDEVQFVYEIAVRRAGNPAGYTWEAAPMLNLEAAEKSDPVAALFLEARPKVGELEHHAGAAVDKKAAAK
jgi:hypothetical protein